MGCIQAQEGPIDDSVEYPRKVQLKVELSITSPEGVPIIERIEVPLPSPKYLYTDCFIMPLVTISLSGCVLPGFDPHQEAPKVCQDGHMAVEAEGQVLVALFDGHGSEGHNVVEFCCTFVKTYFLARLQDFREDCMSAAENMFIECDAQAKLNVNCETSGCTAVVLYFSKLGAMAASVGDSRAVLASLPSLTGVEKKEEPRNINKFARKINISTRTLEAIPVTVDQKPNHAEEMARIRKCGGRVSRLSDGSGNRIGPYRVWKKHAHLPGLAMSRSIGDALASSVGVIATPVIQDFELIPGVDQFIIAGSDGIWDVMSNEEAVQFVEKFRLRCSSHPQPQKGNVKLSSCTISQLLCEEARYRWFGVVEQENVMVDDISCVVLQLKFKNTSLHPVNTERICRAVNVSVSMEQSQEESNMCLQESSSLRDSGIPADEDWHRHKNVVRRDMRRGSVVDEDKPSVA